MAVRQLVWNAVRLVDDGFSMLHSELVALGCGVDEGAGYTVFSQSAPRRLLLRPQRTDSASQQSRQQQMAATRGALTHFLLGSTAAGGPGVGPLVLRSSELQAALELQRDRGCWHGADERTLWRSQGAQGAAAAAAAARARVQMACRGARAARGRTFDRHRL